MTASDREMVTLTATGRTVPSDQVSGSTPLDDLLADETFDTAEYLARFIGRLYGWRSTIPTHPGMTEDGVGWWIEVALDTIHRDTIEPTASGAGYYELVAGMKTITDGRHAHLRAVALEAAGLVTIPVEQAG